MNICVQPTYFFTGNTHLTLPDPITWDDVASWFVKWDILFLTLKNGTELEFNLDSCCCQEMDLKRPASVTLLPVDKDGFADYAHPLDVDE